MPRSGSRPCGNWATNRPPTPTCSPPCGGAWTTAGTGSNAGGGVSSGRSTKPRLAASVGGLHLAWLDDRVASQTGNTVALYAKKWNGSAFVDDTALKTWNGSAYV